MPEPIVLGGGIVDEHYARFAPAIRSRIELATMVPRGGASVVKAALANDAALVGAASLALNAAR